MPYNKKVAHYEYLIFTGNKGAAQRYLQQNPDLQRHLEHNPKLREELEDFGDVVDMLQDADDVPDDLTRCIKQIIKESHPKKEGE